jgi:predicted N-acetyltransferase YhbS
MKLIDLPDFGLDDQEQIVDGEADPYDSDHLGIVWRDKSGHVGLTEEDRLIAHAGWVPIQVQGTTGQVVDVLGLGGVMVHRDFRGKGAGRQVVLGAMTRMVEVGGSIGMLFCGSHRLSFYERIGWFQIDKTVTADQPTGLITMPLVTCWTPLIDGAIPPATNLHIEGLPF